MFHNSYNTLLKLYCVHTETNFSTECEKKGKLEYVM